MYDGSRKEFYREAAMRELEIITRFNIDSHNLNTIIHAYELIANIERKLKDLL